MIPVNFHYKKIKGYIYDDIIPQTEFNSSKNLYSKPKDGSYVLSLDFYANGIIQMQLLCVTQRVTHNRGKGKGNCFDGFW